MSLVLRAGGEAVRLAERLVPKHGGSVSGLPFELVLRAEARLATVPFIRRRVFGDDLAPFERFLSELGITRAENIEAAHRERIMWIWMHFTRPHYATLSTSRQRAWLPLAPDVEDVMQRGALLVGAHFGGAFLTSLALARLQIPLLVIARRPPNSPPLPRNVTLCNLLEASAQHATLTAVATLRRGGVVFLAGDSISTVPTDNLAVNLLG